MAGFAVNGKVNSHVDQVYERIVQAASHNVSNPGIQAKVQNLQNYMKSSESSKRVIRSQSIGEYLQKKLAEPSWETRTKRK